MNLSADKILELLKPSRQTTVFLLFTLTVFSIFGLIIFFQRGVENTDSKVPNASGDALKYIQQHQNAENQVQGLNTESLSLFGPEKPSPTPSPSPTPFLTPSSPLAGRSSPSPTPAPANNNSQSTPTPTPSPSPPPAGGSSPSPTASTSATPN